MDYIKLTENFLLSHEFERTVLFVLRMGLYTATVGGLVAVEYFYGDEISQGFSWIVATISHTWDLITESFTTVVTVWIPYVLNLLWNGLLTFISWPWNLAVLILSFIWTILSSIATWLWDLVTQIWNGFVAILTWIWNLIENIITGIWSILSNPRAWLVALCIVAFYGVGFTIIFVLAENDAKKRREISERNARERQEASER